MLTPNSSPERPSAAARAEAWGRRAPPPQTRRSPSCSIRARSPSSFITSPRTPASAISRFDPDPTTPTSRPALGGPVAAGARAAPAARHRGEELRRPAGADRRQPRERVVALDALAEAGAHAGFHQRARPACRRRPRPCVTSRSPSRQLLAPAPRGRLDRSGSHHTGAPAGPVGRRVGDQLAGHPGNCPSALLAGRVDVEHHDLVGERERAAELAVHVQRARVEVGLEGGDQPRRLERAGGPQGRLDLGRMMGVVVVDRARRRACPRYSKRRAGRPEARERRGRSREVAARRARRRRARPARSGRCARRAPAARRPRDLAAVAAATRELAAARRSGGRPSRGELAAGRCRTRRCARPGGTAAGAPLPDDRRAVLGQPREELVERPLEVAPPTRRWCGGRARRSSRPRSPARGAGTSGRTRRPRPPATPPLPSARSARRRAARRRSRSPARGRSRLEHVRGHRGGRRLAVRAGDRDHAPQRARPRPAARVRCSTGRRRPRAARPPGASAGIAVETTSSTPGSA